MRTAPLALALCLAAPSALAQTDPPALCGHALRLGAGNALLGARTGPVTLAAGAVTFETHALANGAAVIARVSRDEAPIEAVVLTCAGASAPSLAWRGSTAWRGEDVGDRARDEVLAVDLAGGRALVVARRSESPRLCAVGATITEASRVDPATATLTRVAALDPLALAALTATPGARVAAAPAAPAAYAPRNVVTSSGEARALFDRNPATVWAPAAHGFVTLTLPSAALRVRGLDLAPAPVPPRALTVLVEPGPLRFDVALPAAPLRPGQVWRVTLPTPVGARCVSLVARGATPEGALAELTLRTDLDDGPAGLAALARSLDGPDGDAAAALLADLGAAGVDALAAAVSQLGATGARRALRALAAARSPAALAALVAALDRADTADAAAEALRRAGAPALDALSPATATNVRAAAVIAALAAPAGQRLRALAPALAAERDVWTPAKPHLVALLIAASREGAVEGWLATLPDDARAASRALHAAAEALAVDAPSRPAVAARARALWAARDDFETRYRLLAPLAGDAEGAALVAGVLADDADHDLRAEAARALGRSRSPSEALRSALNDRAPRVRAAAAEALADRPDAVAALGRTAANDPWPTVRAAALAALADDAAAAPVLLAALDARSTATVRAAIAALALNPGAGVSARLVAFLDEGRRAPSLRRAAAGALGDRCDASVASDLERVATALTDPALPPWEQEVGHTALASLARVDAARARAFLTRSEANAEAASAVERAARRPCLAP
jgi:hypothetical protein